MIPRSVRLSEAPSHGLPIHLYAPTSKGAEAYRAFASEVRLRDGRSSTPGKRLVAVGPGVAQPEATAVIAGVSA